jgi:Stage II sporulation protein E (SpoIIE)
MCRNASCRLRAQPFNSLSYAAQCRQVRALGGDCFDFLPLGDARVALAIADASGKGLAAALVIANVQSSLRTAAWFAPDDAAAVVHAVNRQLHASSPADRYATLFYGVFDEATHRLEYVNAGHNPPLLIRGGNSLVGLETGGPPVGIFADSVYSAGIVQLNAGDLIVAYTDGVVEARDTAGEEWGVQGLFAAASGARRCNLTESSKPRSPRWTNFHRMARRMIEPSWSPPFTDRRKSGRLRARMAQDHGEGNSQNQAFRHQANRNSLVLSSLMVSRSFAAFSNSKRLACSRISASSF